MCVSACTSLCMRLSGLSFAPNGLMGTPECLSSTPEWDTLRVQRHSRVSGEECLCDCGVGVLVGMGGADCCRPHGDYPPRGAPPPALWTPQTQDFPSTSPSFPLPRLARGPKHTLCWSPHFFLGRKSRAIHPTRVLRPPMGWPTGPQQAKALRHTDTHFFIPLNAGDQGREINPIPNNARYGKM